MPLPAEVDQRVAHEIARARVVGDGQAVATARAQHERAGAREQPVAARDDREPHRDAAGLLHPGARRLGVHRVRQQDELGRLQRAAGHRPQRELRAEAVAGEQRAAARRSLR